jgi:hypothetical protein
MIRSCLLLLGVLILAGCKKGDDTATKPGETRLGPKGETTIASADLTRIYLGDPEAFNKRFQNKMVIVEGVIAWDSMKDEMGRELLPLEGHDDILIRCMRTGNFADQVMGLRAGKKITVRGRAHPYEEGRRAVLLSECDLVPEAK